MRVVLDHGEAAVARSMATMRRLINEESSVTDTRRDVKRQPIDIENLGTLSELAWAKALNVFPDFSIEPRSGGFDSVVGSTTFDIKATDQKSGQLLVTPKKSSSPADVYVLAIVSDRVVDFVGWALPCEVFDELTLTDLGYGPTHAVKQSRLHAFAPKDLKKLGITDGT